MISTVLLGAVLGAGVFMAMPRTRATTVGAVAGILSGPQRDSPRRTSSGERERIDAIACWTEQLRDTVSAAGGLVQAISATEEVSPPSLAPHVRQLVADLAYLDPAVALRRFAATVDHPACDFVVAVLLAAQRHPVRDLSQLLGHLASCSREESRAHLRVWVGRARTRRAVRIITAVVVTFVAGLVAVSPGYMGPYASLEGAFVAGIVVCMFVVAFWRLSHLSRTPPVPRLLGSVDGLAG